MFTLWGELPAELKAIVVKELDNNTRLSLQACSWNEKKLVDSVPFGKIHTLELDVKHDCFSIKLKTNSGCSLLDSYIYETFEDFQEKLLSVMKKVHYIGWLRVATSAQNKSTKKFKFTTTQRRIHVVCLTCENQDTLNVLKQVEPLTLTNLEIDDGSQTEIYNMTQVQSVETLKIKKCSIRDDQLLKLNAKTVTLECSELEPSITSAGINQYIKITMNCVNFDHFLFQNLTQVVPSDILDGLTAEFDESSNEHLVTSSFSDLKLLISHNSVSGVRTRVIYPPRRCDSPVGFQADFRVVDSMCIRPDGKRPSMIIYGKNQETVHETYFMMSQLQSDLNEQLKNIHYVRNLRLEFRQGFSSQWKFPFPNDKLTVGRLILYGVEHTAEDMTEFLGKFEVGHLKQYERTGGLANDERTFDLQQLIKAERVSIKSSNCCIRDEQLLELEATEVILESSEISVAGLNTYIKKCVDSLNQNDCYFNITVATQEKEKDFLPELLEGLEVIRCERKQNEISQSYHEIRINSKHENIKFKLVVDGCRVEGRFEEK